MKNSLLFVLCFVAVLACTNNNSADDSNWKETYATLYSYGYGRGASNMVFYWVDGKRYEVSGDFDANGQVIGDKYLIKYNPHDPKQIKEYTWNVGFLETEKTKETIGIVKDVDSKYTDFGRKKISWVSFTYTINGKTYERTQDLKPNFKEEYPNLSVGKKYTVRYWDENPQRSILDYKDKR